MIRALRMRLRWLLWRMRHRVRMVEHVDADWSDE